jgi:hypothetical protein
LGENEFLFFSNPLLELLTLIGKIEILQNELGCSRFPVGHIFDQARHRKRHVNDGQYHVDIKCAEILVGDNFRQCNSGGVAHRTVVLVFHSVVAPGTDDSFDHPLRIDLFRLVANEAGKN